MLAPLDPRDAFGAVPIGHWSIPALEAGLRAGKPPGTFRCRPVRQGEYLLRRIGGREYRRPLSESFYEFLGCFVIEQLGGLWWLFGELRKPEDERHVVTAWFSSHIASLRAAEGRLATTGAEQLTLPMTGYQRELLSLGYELALLIDRDKLPAALLGRLRKRTEYQGARFEIKVAAICIRAGLDITYVSGSGVPTAEFNAIDPATGATVGVEAKSRHRAGTLHEAGQSDPQRSARADVKRLVREALVKDRQGRPFFVFIDVNAPSDNDKPPPEQRWFRDAFRRFGPLNERFNEKISKINAIFFLNFAFHYAGEQEPPRGEALFSVGERPEYVLPLDVVGRVCAAALAHGVPDEMLTEADLAACFVKERLPELAEPDGVIASYFASISESGPSVSDLGRLDSLFHPNGMVWVKRLGRYAGWRSWREYAIEAKGRWLDVDKVGVQWKEVGTITPTSDTLSMAIRVEWTVGATVGNRWIVRETMQFHLWHDGVRWWIQAVILG